MKRWTAIRDSFMRSLRTKTGQGAKKKYIFNEHLQFLLKITQKEETVTNYCKTTNNDETTDEFPDDFSHAESSTSPVNELPSAVEWEVNIESQPQCSQRAQRPNVNPVNKQLKRKNQQF